MFCMAFVSLAEFPLRAVHLFVYSPHGMNTHFIFLLSDFVVTQFPLTLRQHFLFIFFRRNIFVRIFSFCWRFFLFFSIYEFIAYYRSAGIRFCERRIPWEAIFILSKKSSSEPTTIRRCIFAFENVKVTFCQIYTHATHTVFPQHTKKNKENIFFQRKKTKKKTRKYWKPNKRYNRNQYKMSGREKKNTATESFVRSYAASGLPRAKKQKQFVYWMVATASGFHLFWPCAHEENLLGCNR